MENIKIVHNIETNEIQEIELNAQEIAQREKDAKEFAQTKAKAEAQLAAKAELLKRLGLTEDEAKLLLA